MSQTARNRISTIGFVVIVVTLILLISYLAASNGFLGPGLRAAVGARARLSVAGSCEGTRTLFTISNSGGSSVGAGFVYALSDSRGTLLESGQVNLESSASMTVTPAGGTQPYTLQITQRGSTVGQAEKSCP